MKASAYLCLGSNVGNRVRNLEGALVFLAELPETVLDGFSRYYETKPVGVENQRDFINRVIRIKTNLSPQELKERTRRIEDYYGRDRSMIWGPRALDIDILWFDGQMINDPDLIIPHPRMWERAFVLVPLAELAPELTGPDGRTCADLAAAFDLTVEGVRVYEPTQEEQWLDRPFPSLVLAGLDPEELGQPLLYELVVESTNEQLRRLADEGAPEGTAIIAETQIKGRGRKGRPWVSQPFAGVWLSVLLRPGIKPAFVPSLTIIGSLAMARALNRYAPTGEEKVLIKWPNDLLIKGAKIGGCLAEAGVQGEKVSHVVLGIGVNISQTADELPDFDQRITSVGLAWQKQLSRPTVIKNFFLELTGLYHDYLKHGLERILAEYESLSCTLGRQVQVLGPESFVGIASQITPSGSLIVVTSDGAKEVFAAEVSVRDA